MSYTEDHNDYLLLHCGVSPSISEAEEGASPVILLPASDVRYIVRADETLLIEGVSAVLYDRRYHPVYGLSDDWQITMGRKKEDAFCLLLSEVDGLSAALTCRQLQRVSIYQLPRVVSSAMLPQKSLFESLLVYEGQWFPLARAKSITEYLEFGMDKGGVGYERESACLVS